MTATERYTSVADGYHCADCSRVTTNCTMHTLLAHTWPFRRWT